MDGHLTMDDRNAGLDDFMRLVAAWRGGRETFESEFDRLLGELVDEEAEARWKRMASVVWAAVEMTDTAASAVALDIEALVQADGAGEADEEFDRQQARIDVLEILTRLEQAVRSG